MSRTTTLAGVLLALALPLGAATTRAADRFVLLAQAPAVAVPVGGGTDAKSYLEAGAAPLRVPLTGPGEITGYARIALAADSDGTVAGRLRAAGLAAAPETLSFDFKPSRESVWGDDRPGVPSGGRRFTLAVPDGDHVLSLTGAADGGGPLLVILYYEGPPQPVASGRPPLVASAPDDREDREPVVTFVGSAGLDIMYNDNILANSPDYDDEFFSGNYPWKYVIQTTDDLVIAPEFEIEARADLFDWGQSRLRFKTKRWMYARNPIKTNTDFHFYLRQYFGRGNSLELYFHFAPEQYIRQLSDRSPLDDPDGPLNWTEFRFQRNVWNASWRQRLSRSLSARLIYEQNHRYYNQPFIENDIDAWEVRGNLAWRMSDVLSWDFDYSYEDAAGRGVDEPGETPLTSDDSDPSYERDLYRLGLDIEHEALARVLDRISLSFLFMDYYYTTTKSLVQDPYHAGRRDMFYKGTVELRRRLSRPVTLRVAVRYTERVVDSPWEGDITTDKDFTQWLYWTSLDYRF